MSLEGKQIDRYAISRLLGSGGMGDVYLAEDPRIGQQVALKVIRTELSPYPDEQAVHNAARLFQREAKAIVKLDHPHILPLYDYGEEHIGNAPVIYLVMPYRPEGSLTDWLRHRENKDVLSPQDIAQLVSQAADALQHAHEHQVIHQDVKPSNFLVRARPDAPTHPDLLLSDFGIARLTTATSSVSQSIRGTPAYMAPEQWEGEPVPATDQYALAVMTYELLTGKLPFQGGPGKMMYHHINTPPLPPSSINSRLSSDIDIVLMQALAKQPDQRFASMKAFANAFQQAAQSMHGMQTIYSATREEIATVAVDEAGMMVPTLTNTDVQNAGSDSETYVKTVETPVSFASTSTSRGTVALPESIAPVVTTGARPRKNRRKPLPILALIAFLLAIVGGGMVYALPILFNGVSGMTRVTISPANSVLNSAYTFLGLTGAVDISKNQVKVRKLSITLPSQSIKEKATGIQDTPATYARGILTFTNPDTNSVTVTAGTIYTSLCNNISVATEVTATIPPNQSLDVPSIATTVGAIGNIQAYCFPPPAYCTFCSVPFSWVNRVPFTGGQDAQNYTFVQQSDINNAANTLERANTPNPQQIIQPLIHANERLIGTPTCNPNVTSDHKAGDKASTVTVSVNFSCTGEVYDYDGALAMAAQLLTNQASTQLGSGYALVEKIKTTLTSATLTDAKSGTITLLVDTEGLWVYQFTDAQKQALAKLIAGKTKSAAQSLLALQAGIGQVVITVSGGNSSTLPNDASKITIVVNNASG